MDTDPVAALRAIPLFSGLDDDALTDLAACTTAFEAPAGRVLVGVGQPGAGLFVIGDGEVEVELQGRVVKLGPGAFFGEVSLLVDRPRTGRVRARTNVRCWALSRHEFGRLLGEQPRIAVQMLPVLAARLADAT
jgi:CRP/FNR family cyclic AMP-dependent transcriptional regulator